MISTSDAARRSRSRADARPALGSVVVHGVALALAWVAATRRPEPIDFVSFQIDMVSMPAAADLGSPVVEVPPAAQPPAAEPTPAPPEPAKAETKAPPAPEPKKEPTPAPAPTTAPSTARPTTPTPKPTTSGPTTDRATGSESADAINIRIEGLRRDYPAYYNNIILQIQRCLRWAGSEPFETELYFVIEKNGSASNVAFVRRSRSYAFDTEAMGAVECAGARFGPLPDDFQFDRLPVRFTFRPRSTGTFR